MKKILKEIALLMAFLMLMTSCYTTRVAVPEEDINDFKQYISTLESGERIRITSYDLEKRSLHFLATNGELIKGFDLSTPTDHRFKSNNQYSIEIASIKKIEKVSTGTTIVAVILGTLGVIMVIGAIDMSINGIF